LLWQPHEIFGHGYAPAKPGIPGRELARSGKPVILAYVRCVTAIGLYLSSSADNRQALNPCSRYNTIWTAAGALAQGLPESDHVLDDVTYLILTKVSGLFLAYSTLFSPLLEVQSWIIGLEGRMP